MNTMKKALAVLATATVAMSAMAVTVSAEGGATIEVAKVEVEVGTTDVVPVALTITGNEAGYASAGFVINYDPNLTWAADSEQGDGSKGLTLVEAADEANYALAEAFAGSKLCTNDGDVITMYFTIPEDAQEGDEYPITLTVNKFNDDAQNAMEYTAADGYIKVVAAATEATDAPTEATEAPTEATDAPTEATEAPTAAPTEAPATTVATIPNTNTGAAGVAVAATGLMTAVATAFVLRKKN